MPRRRWHFRIDRKVLIRIRILLKDQVVYYKYSEQSLSKSIVNKLYKFFDPSKRSRGDYFRSRIGSIVWPPQICPHPIKRQCFSTRLDSAIFSSISVHTGFVRLILAKSARVANTLPPVLNDPIFTSNTSPLDSFGTYGYRYLYIFNNERMNQDFSFFFKKKSDFTKKQGSNFQIPKLKFR